MAITVSLTYMILTMPAVIIAYLDVMKNEGKYIGTLALPEIIFFRDISIILRDLNHAINFFLYLLILPKVRCELAAMWRAVIRICPCSSTSVEEKYSAK